MTDQLKNAAYSIEQAFDAYGEGDTRGTLGFVLVALRELNKRICSAAPGNPGCDRLAHEFTLGSVEPPMTYCKRCGVPYDFARASEAAYRSGRSSAARELEELRAKVAELEKGAPR